MEQELDMSDIADKTTNQGDIPAGRFTPEAEQIAKDARELLKRMKTAGIRTFAMMWLPLNEPKLAAMIGVTNRDGRHVDPLDLITEQPMVLLNLGADRAAPLAHYVTDICERLYHAAGEQAIDGSVMDALAMFGITREQFGAKLEEREKAEEQALRNAQALAVAHPGGHA